MATEDWFDPLTTYMPSADLIDDWIDEPASRPEGLTIDFLLGCLSSLYEDRTELLAELNKANVECTRLRARVHELEEPMRNDELYKTWREMAKNCFPD